MANLALFEQFTTALNMTADMAEAAVKTYQAAIQASQKELAVRQLATYSIANINTTSSDIYIAILRKYGRMAAIVARDYYIKAQRASSMASEDVYEPDITDVMTRVDITTSEIERQNRTPINEAEWIARKVREIADNEIYQYAAEHKRHPKIAIVAHPGACGFCRLMSSNGFVYWTKAKADNARHTNCKCSLCVEFDDDEKLEGYEPQKYREQYNEVRKEAQAEAREKWAQLTPAEQAQWKSKTKKLYMPQNLSEHEYNKYNKYNYRGAYDHFYRNILVSKMDAGRSHQKAE